MPETRELNLTLDFCLRVGELLLASGAGAADVTATMLSLARKLGATSAEVDLTFTSLTMTHQPDPEERPLQASRVVRERVIDYQDLTRVDHLVRAVLRDETDLMGARARRQIVSTGHDRPRWAVTLGWGVMCGGVAVMLGGTWAVIALAVISAMGIDRLQEVIKKRRLPFFYQQLAGGLLASLLAVTAASTPLDIDVSQVITANIVMLLAGIAFMGALQDALTGFYITAGARITEAVLATSGIIAGVSGGLGLAGVVGLDLPNRLEPGRVGLQDFELLTLGAAICAAGFAFASYSPKRMLAPVAVVAVCAIAISQSIEEPGFGRTWSVGFAAFFVGLVAYTVAGRLRVPPLVVVVSSVVPMLPGISIFRGLALVAEGDTFGTSRGLVSLITAASVALAIAAGVILGEYVAQPLTREARRVEARLSGPRLVGPVRILGRRSRGAAEQDGQGATGGSSASSSSSD